MPRPKNLISYANFNDCGGDLQKKWYVEYAFRIPGVDKEFRRRHYICAGDDHERRERAAQMVVVINEYLRSGEYLRHDSDYSPVREIDTYRQEAQTYYAENDRRKVKSLTAAYMESIRPTIRPSSYRTYDSEFKAFRKYVEEQLNDPVVSRIGRAELLPFFSSLASESGCCQKTVLKYVCNIRKFFDFCIDCGYVETNPVYRIPKYGHVVDCSTDPLTMDDRIRLRDAIKPREPYFWLACELQYYCAIRPGMELRLLKVGDIDRDRMVITIPADVAKNKQTESVAVPEHVLRYMEELGVFCYDPSLYLFGHSGVPGRHPLGVSTMRVRFNQYRRELGISDTKKFYSWKHSGAISAADNGIPVFELKDHMRHKSIVTTEIYLRKRVRRIGCVDGYIERI